MFAVSCTRQVGCSHLRTCSGLITGGGKRALCALVYALRLKHGLYHLVHGLYHLAHGLVHGLYQLVHDHLEHGPCLENGPCLLSRDRAHGPCLLLL